LRFLILHKPHACSSVLRIRLRKGLIKKQILRMIETNLRHRDSYRVTAQQPCKRLCHRAKFRLARCCGFDDAALWAMCNNGASICILSAVSDRLAMRQQLALQHPRASREFW
jgi:hypothetical protein